MGNRRSIGQNRTTVTGRIVYDRKTRPFTLVRLAKIFTQLMNKYPTEDVILRPNTKYQFHIAPSSTIFYFFQQALVWLDNRGEIENIFGAGEIGKRIDGLRAAKSSVPPEVFMKSLEAFYQWFDTIVGFIDTGLKWLVTVAPELEFLVGLDRNLIRLYQKVRAEFPLVSTPTESE